MPIQRSTSFEPCWIRRHRQRFPQSNQRLSTRSIHTYPTRRRPLRNDWKPRSYISYNCNCGRSPIPEEHFGLEDIQGHNGPLSVWDDFKASLSILLTTVPSACECLNCYNAFYGSSYHRFRWLLLVYCWMLIVRPRHSNWRVYCTRFSSIRRCFIETRWCI